MPEPLLAGTVVLTRERQDNAALARELGLRGAEVLEIPCVRTELVEDLRPLAAAVRALGPDDRLVVTSPRGAEAVLASVRADEIRAPVTAIGEATALRLRRAGVPAEVARVPTGAALARQLALPRGRVLLARSERALADLPQGLRARGALVEEVVAYRTVAGARGDVQGLRTRLRLGEIVVVALASPSAVDALVDVIPASEVARARLVALGPTTATRIRERAGVESVVAENPTDDALLAAIERCLKEALRVARS